MAAFAHRLQPMTVCAALSLILAQVLLLLPVRAQESAQTEKPEELRCIAQSGQRSACVKLNACRPLLELLRQGRDRPLPLTAEHVQSRSQYGRGGLPDPEATAILRRAHCGFEGNIVMVCCPPDELQSFPRPKDSNGDELSVSFAGPSAYPGHPGPQAPAGPQEAPAPLLGAAQEMEQGTSPPPSSAPLDTKNLALLPMEICGLSAPLGEPSSYPNRSALQQYPWMARLGYRQADGTVEYFCSGSLISERYVLTAAHCINVHNGPTSVRIGEQDAETDPDCSGSTCAPNVIDVDIQETLIHESYGHGINDIALIRLEKPAIFSEAISPVCLPVPTQESPAQNLVGQTLTVTGWGKSAPYRRFHAPSRWLLQTRVPVEQAAACQSAYSGADDVLFTEDAHLCVGGRVPSGCQGDSGSPLVQSESRRGPGPPQRVVQHGLLSFGLADCALRSAPVVYTKLSHYVPWIVNHLQPAPFVPKDVTSGSGYVDPRQQ